MINEKVVCVEADNYEEALKKLKQGEYKEVEKELELHLDVKVDCEKILIKNLLNGKEVMRDYLTSFDSCHCEDCVLEEVLDLLDTKGKYLYEDEIELNYCETELLSNLMENASRDYVVLEELNDGVFLVAKSHSDDFEIRCLLDVSKHRNLFDLEEGEIYYIEDLLED